MGNGYGNEEVYKETVDFARDPDAGEHRSFSGIVGDTPLNIRQIESAQDYLKNYFEPQAQAYNEYYDKMSSYVNNENSRRKSFFDLLTGSKDNSNPNTQVNPSFYKEAGWGIAPGGSMALLPTALPPPEYLPKTTPYRPIPNPQWNRVSVSGGKANLPTGGSTPKDKYYNPPITFDNGTTEKPFDSAGQTYEEYASTDQATMTQNIKQTVDKYAKDGYVKHFTQAMNLSGPYSGEITLVNNPKQTYKAPDFSKGKGLYSATKQTVAYVLTALKNYESWKAKNPSGNIKEYQSKVDKSGIPDLSYYVSNYNGIETTLADWIGVAPNGHIYFTDEKSQKAGVSKLNGHDIVLDKTTFKPGIVSQYVKLKLDNIVANLLEPNRKKMYGTYYDRPPKDRNLLMAKERAWQNDISMLVEQMTNEMWTGNQPF